ncbi:MAG: hypothetical protein LBP51_07055 [Deferribacteraceae bacterium]|jgi:hypothetical protein|nr:hypothetical protein [Deferribacteraceae bacterium]
MKKSFLILLFFLILLIAASCGGGGGGSGGGAGDAPSEKDWSIYDWLRSNQNAASNESCIAECHGDAAYKLGDNSSIIKRIRGSETADELAKANYQASPHLWSWKNSGGCANSCHERDAVENEELNLLFNFITDTALLSEDRIGGASCAGCHKIEGGHYGKKDVLVNLPGGGAVSNPNATDASWECYNCHESATDHNPPASSRYFTENLGTAFRAGLHASSSRTAYQDAKGNIKPDSYCGFCHSYNYSWKYNPLNGSKNVAEIKALLGEHPFEKMANTPLSCATCHDPHGGGLSEKVEEVKDWGKLIYSKEFVLCTSCHTVRLE